MFQKLRILQTSLYKRFNRNRKGFRHHGQLVPFLSAEEGNDHLRLAIATDTPLMVARHGSNELNFVSRPNPNNFKELCGIAGFFPSDWELGQDFVKLYCEAAKDVDILAIWNYRHGRFKNEERLFNLCAPDASLIDLASLTPFLFRRPWTEALAGKSVLVLHPFAETILRQYEQSREKLFQNPGVLPEFKSLQVIPAVQSMGGQVKGFTNWFEALDAMCRAIEGKDFDIALIGCGAYGLPLATHVKGLGKQAIHVGGALQLLFGIKGRRWEGGTGGYFYDQKYYNEYWVRPSDEERPTNAAAYEGGCYW